MSKERKKLYDKIYRCVERMQKRDEIDANLSLEEKKKMRSIRTLSVLRQLEQETEPEEKHQNYENRPKNILFYPHGFNKREATERHTQPITEQEERYLRSDKRYFYYENEAKFDLIDKAIDSVTKGILGWKLIFEHFLRKKKKEKII